MHVCVNYITIGMSSKKDIVTQTVTVTITVTMTVTMTVTVIVIVTMTVIVIVTMPVTVTVTVTMTVIVIVIVIVIVMVPFDHLRDLAQEIRNALESNLFVVEFWIHASLNGDALLNFAVLEVDHSGKHRRESMELRAHIVFNLRKRVHVYCMHKECMHVYDMHTYIG